MNELLRKECGEKLFDTEINGEITFFGVLDDKEAWEVISEGSKGWNLDTQEKYLKEYVNLIIPYVNEKPLIEYTKKDFESALARIRTYLRRSGKTFHATRMHTIAYKIGKVTYAAYECKYVEIDVLWGTRFQIKEAKPQTKAEKALVRNPKSLSIETEIIIADTLLNDPEADGQNIGLALMFCLGLRENEACAVTFRDIHQFECDNTRHSLWIYKTSDKDSRDNKYSGKTKNASRIIPVPDKLFDLLMQRRNYIAREEEKRTDLILKYTIACHGHNYMEACKPSELGTAGTRLLRSSKVSEDMVKFIDEDIDRESELEPGVIEKDPTAYLFRRNLATHLYILGLEESEIQYIMGHDISDENDQRNYFRNEEKLLRIAEKMDRRPLVNSDRDDLHRARGHFESQNVSSLNLEIDIPDNANRINMIVSKREPYSKTEIVLDESVIGGKYYSTIERSPYEPTINIIPTYHERYEAKKRPPDEPDGRDEETS